MGATKFHRDKFKARLERLRKLKVLMVAKPGSRAYEKGLESLAAELSDEDVDRLCEEAATRK